MMVIALIAVVAYLIIGTILSSMGEMAVYDYRSIPDTADFYTISNEDMGFIANLVAGTNHVYSFHLPLPSHIDLLTETTMLDAIEFQFLDHGENQTSGDGSLINYFLNAWIGYPDRDWSATFQVLSDTDDEAYKSKLGGPIKFGNRYAWGDAPTPATTDNVNIQINFLDAGVDAIYFPPVPLDQLIPIQIDLINGSTTTDPTDMSATDRTFDQYEKVGMRIWYRIRNLTRDERMIRNIAMRFLRIES